MSVQLYLQVSEASSQSDQSKNKNECIKKACEQKLAD
jgi:hypothetical protein